MRSELAVKRRPRLVAGAFFLPAAFFAGARRAATFFVAFFAVDLTTLAAVLLRATDFLAVARLRGAAGLVVLRRRAFGAASASGWFSCFSPLCSTASVFLERDGFLPGLVPSGSSPPSTCISPLNKSMAVFAT